MMTTAILQEGRFHWGIAIAGAIAAAATSFFLLTLGTGVGLALAPSHLTGGKVVTFLSLGAVYFFAAQAFGFAVGGYLVGRLIGPESGENRKEEEFRAAAHGFVMWAVAIVAGLLIMAVSSGATGSAIANANGSNPSDNSDYFVDLLFRGAPASAQLEADKAEASRILAITTLGVSDGSDTARLGRLVSQDVNLSASAGLERVADVEARAKTAANQTRKATSIVFLWTALSLLFGNVVAVAAAISARWMDDRITFSMARRY
jgi:FtsH-binding integral membrane protein